MSPALAIMNSPVYYLMLSFLPTCFICVSVPGASCLILTEVVNSVAELRAEFKDTQPHGGLDVASVVSSDALETIVLFIELQKSKSRTVTK
jgi:hypothetical protein